MEYNLLIFFKEWLQNNGWIFNNTFHSSLYYYSTYLYAEKNKAQLFAHAVPPFVSSRHVSKTYLQNDYYRKLGDALLYWLNEKIKNKAISPVLLIAGDEDTLDAALNYLPYFKKLGIKVFAVTNAQDVLKL